MIAATVDCSFCGHTFNEDEHHAACSSCAMFGGCRMVRCPKCGYEMPESPNVVKTVRRWLDRRRSERTAR